MDPGRGASAVRWHGVGGTGRRHAGLGWLVPLLERNLRPGAPGAPDVVSVRLAAFLQRAALHRFRLHRTGTVRELFAAFAGEDLSGDHACDAACRGSEPLEARVLRQPSNFRGHRRMRRCGAAALSPNHCSGTALETALAGSAGNGGVGNRRRPVALRPRSRLRLSRWRFSSRLWILRSAWDRRC